MVLKAKSAPRGEPVPVVLTGPVWSPSGGTGNATGTKPSKNPPVESDHAERRSNIIIAILLILAIPSLWIIFTTPSPSTVPGIPPGLQIAVSPGPASGVSPLSGTLVANASPAREIASSTDGRAQPATTTASPPLILGEMLASPAAPPASAAPPVPVIQNAPGESVPTESKSQAPASFAPTIEPSGKRITGVSALKQRSGMLVGLRDVFVAAGWKILWMNHRKGAECRGPDGEILRLLPDRHRLVLSGRRLPKDARVELTRDGRLFVSREALQQVFGSRVTIEPQSGRSEVTVVIAPRDPPGQALAVRPPRHSSGTLVVTGVPVIRRSGRTLVALRQVLEADGWTVEWKGMRRGALFHRDGGMSLAVVPGRSKVTWGTRRLKSRPAPVIFKGRLFLPVNSLNRLFGSMIEVEKPARGASELEIRIIRTPGGRSP